MKLEAYQPPYTMTEKMVDLVAEISEAVGSITAWQHMNSNPQLRRSSRIRTIHASLAIENNSLSLDQMTAIIDGKRIAGTAAEIQEVKNAYKAYDQMLTFDPYSISNLLKAHALLMDGLVKESGCFRSGSVGVFNGDKLIHMAPPASMVQEDIEQLLNWAKASKAHPLIKSCVFHYEFEFIHPFADGNGRMGRMWNTLLLYKWKPVFAWIPVETVIQKRQAEYYAALGKADRSGDSTQFVEFLLLTFLETLHEIQREQQLPQRTALSPQMLLFLDKLGSEELSASEIMQRMGLKNRPAFRKTYLKPALDSMLIEMTLPEKPNSRNQKYRKR